jgi:hypothetical protein
LAALARQFALPKEAPFMHLRVHLAPGFEIAPTWLVSDGDLTIGPVDTDLLVRGFLSGKIPGDCRVRTSQDVAWRSLDQVREIRAAQRGWASAVLPEAERILRGPREMVRWLADASDGGEALVMALHGACAITQAAIGILYRVREPLDLPVISACFGDPLLGLGEVVPRRDPALCLAFEGEPTVLEPDASLAARAVTSRLCPERHPAGLAVIPIRATTQLFGVVELARFDHPFRSADARALVPLMTATVARLEELAWES